MSEAEVIARLRRIATDAGGARPARRRRGARRPRHHPRHDRRRASISCSTDPPASVGWKLVAVNLSDLAAKGATPRRRLAVADHVRRRRVGRATSSSGVEAACESYGLPLIGGDTIALPPGAPRVLGLTAIGAPGQRVPDRAGGRPGDRLWLVGTLGDAAAGLAQLRGDPQRRGPAGRHLPPAGAAARRRAGAGAACPRDDGRVGRPAARRAAAWPRRAAAARHRPRRAAAVARVHRRARRAARARLFAATGGDDYALLAALPAGRRPVNAFFTRRDDDGPHRDARPPAAGDPAASATGEPVALPETLGFEHRTITSRHFRCANG